MTLHLEPGELLALRDGPATASPEAHRHLASCATCREDLEALRMRESVVADALSVLDDDADIEAARAAVRARVAAATGAAAGARTVTGRRSRRIAWTVSRAAGLLLVTAAAVSAALPGSPVRGWLSERFGGAGVAATAAVESVPDAATAPEATGVRLSVPTGPLRVVLRDVVAGTEVRVRLIAGTEAAVFAPAGSHFTSAAGRVEVRSAPGEVRVELPTGVDPVTLEVGGRIYLRNTDLDLDIRGPVVSRSDTEILFRVPG